MQWEIRGDRSGRVWRLHPTLHRLQANGERYRAQSDDGSYALIHRCEKGGLWDDEIERMRIAIALADREEIRGCRTIRQLIDVSETYPPADNEWNVLGYLTEIWEWAAFTLDDLFEHPEDVRPTSFEGVGENVSAALATLHGMGIVHCDVAPNNIFFVAGRWKLGDLDSCVLRGEPATRMPLDERYVHPALRDGPLPARDEFDDWPLAQVIAEVRARS